MSYLIFTADGCRFHQLHLLHTEDGIFLRKSKGLKTTTSGVIPAINAASINKCYQLLNACPPKL